MATTLSLDDIREQTRIRYGSNAKTLLVNSIDGTDPGSFPETDKGERPTNRFKTVRAAIQQRNTFSALTTTVIAFDGLQSMTVDNPDYWGFTYDYRNIIVPSNTRLKGASPATSIFLADGVGSASSHVVAPGGDDVLMENFAIRLIDSGGVQLPIGFNAQIGATPPSKRIRARGLLIDGFSDGFWFRPVTSNTVADWIVEDCTCRVNYDGHTILGNAGTFSPEVRIDYRNCNFIARGPATFSPFNICRAVTGTDGTAIFRHCNLITETTGGATTVLVCVYARAASGQVSRIELHDTLVQTRVPAGYSGTNQHLRTDVGCEILASMVSHDRSKNSDASNGGAGTITIQDPALGNVTIQEQDAEVTS